MKILFVVAASLWAIADAAILAVLAIALVLS